MKSHKSKKGNFGNLKILKIQVWGMFEKFKIRGAELEILKLGDQFCKYKKLFKLSSGKLPRG